MRFRCPLARRPAYKTARRSDRPESIARLCGPPASRAVTVALGVAGAEAAQASRALCVSFAHLGNGARFDGFHHLGIAAAHRFVELVEDRMFVFGVIVARPDEGDVVEGLELRGDGRALRGVRISTPGFSNPASAARRVRDGSLAWSARAADRAARPALREESRGSHASLSVFSSTTENSGTSFTPSRCARTAMKSPSACSIGKNSSNAAMKCLSVQLRSSAGCGRADQPTSASPASTVASNVASFAAEIFICQLSSPATAWRENRPRRGGRR